MIFLGAGQSLPIQKFPLGDIEETAPGQFKCRFCDKTFDRVFSVHRHERVHTGFKPCVCKTCGRGFSEKRNLRHHIIRFHSDGSGRELLKRKRKPKNECNFDHSSANQSHDNAMLIMQQQQKHSQLLMNSGTDQSKLSSSAFMSSLLSSAGSLLAGAFQFPNKPNSGGQTETSGSLSNLKLSLAELNRIKSVPNIGNDKEISQDDDAGSGDEDLSLIKTSSEAINLSSLPVNPTSSNTARYSHRRKSKPSKKVVSQDENEDEEDEEAGNDDNKSNQTEQSKESAIQDEEAAIENGNNDKIADKKMEMNENERFSLGETLKNNAESDGEETEEEEEENENKKEKDEANSDTEPELEEQPPETNPKAERAENEGKGKEVNHLKNDKKRYSR